MDQFQSVQAFNSNLIPIQNLSIQIQFNSCWIELNWLSIPIQFMNWSEPWSQRRYNTLATHIPFVPCRSALSFLGYSYFKIWHWKFKVKVMGVVKVESHNMGQTFSQLTSLSFHVNRASHSWVTPFSKFDLEKSRSRSWFSRSRSWVRSQFKVTMWV